MQSTLLRARGLHTFKNFLSEIPEGALLKADNIVIDRDGIIEPRRGLPLYGDSLGVLGATRAKQLLTYKNRIIRHFLDDLEFDDGEGNFTAFNGSFTEVDDGLRIKGIEANGNFYFTTVDGIKKISATSASQFTSASGYVTNAGGIRGTSLSAIINYTNPGFLSTESKVAYRVVWGIRDVNNNVILGSPSERLVVTNISTVNTGTVDLTIFIPVGVTTDYFYQVYRTAVLERGSLTLDEIDPGEEMNLVLEAFVSSSDIANTFVTINESTPDSFRVSGTLLYTNPVSGEGILQANEPPPVAKDLALFKTQVYYANTRTKHTLELDFLSVDDFISGNASILIADANNNKRLYFFFGVQEVTDLTFDIQANITDGSYFLLYTGNDTRFYVVYMDKTGTTPAPTGPDTVGALAIIQADISGSVTATDVINVVETAINANTNSDFETTQPGGNALRITNFKNGPSTGVIDGLVTGATLSITTITEGRGEDAISQEPYLSNDPSSAVAIEETAQSFVRVVNADPQGLVYAQYISGEDDLPGKIFLQKRDNEDTTFYLASHSSITTEFNPVLPGYGEGDITAPSTIDSYTPHNLNTGDNVLFITNINIQGIHEVTVVDPDTFTIADVASGNDIGIFFFIPSVFSVSEVNPNRLYYSKPGQPEAVPTLNYIDIGPKDQEIRRILPLRDCIICAKDEGIYRITNDAGQVPVATLIDSSISILAPDSACVLNNLVYLFCSEGIAAINDSTAELISREIEDVTSEIANSKYTNNATATFGVGYETDRCYLFFTVTDVGDEVATQCYRYNFITQCWTRWDVSATCGIVSSRTDKLHLGAGNTNYLLRERKNRDRKDYADRETETTVLNNGVNGTTVSLGSVASINERDALVQTQYVTISQFNTLLKKLDTDPILDDSDYFSSLELTVGKQLNVYLTALIDKLNIDDGAIITQNFVSGDVDTGTDTVTITSHGYSEDQLVRFTSSVSLPGGIVANQAYYIIDVTTDTFRISETVGGTAVDITSGGSGTHRVSDEYYFSGTNIFETIQEEYNLTIYQLNVSMGVFWSDYALSEGTVEIESIVTSVNGVLNRVALLFEATFLQGNITSFAGIPTNVVWAPQFLEDPSVMKHIREGTFLFEETTFFGGDVAYRSDLSRNFDEISFELDGPGEWGTFEWGNLLWGGDGTQAPIRTLVPRQKQRCRWLEPQFLHTDARQKYSLIGISLTFEMNSERAYRANG